MVDLFFKLTMKILRQINWKISRKSCMSMTDHLIFLFEAGGFLTNFTPNIPTDNSQLDNYDSLEMSKQLLLKISKHCPYVTGCHLDH